MNTQTRHLEDSLKDPGLFKTQAFINGEWTACNGQTFSVNNPSTGEPIAQVTQADTQATQTAIVAAQKAFESWRMLTANQRAHLLLKWYELLMNQVDDIARILTTEQGKPYPEAKGEVSYGASFIRWFAEEGQRLYGQTIPTHDTNKRLMTLVQPIGVCAAITPWNFPIAMITRKIAPALAAGCSVIVKPAGETPLTALAAIELARRAGIPQGVINILPAHRQNSSVIGKLLCESPIVRHLSFTGSTAVGRILMSQSASTIKKISLELGGNAPFIVFEDADISSAVAGAMAAKYRNAGQVCVAANRFYVHASVYDQFSEQLAQLSSELKVGDGFEAGVQVGPLIDFRAVEKVQMFIKDALSKGAKLLCGGHAISGQFFEPTILTQVNAQMQCTQDEVFGPVMPLVKFTDEADAIRQANDTIYGLAAYFYSRDIGRIFRVAEALEYGMVGINTGLISSAQTPFGGVKQSGLGREGGQEGIKDYVETKYLCLGDLAC